MTNREKYLHRLNQARIAHTQWTGTIKLLASGLIKNKSQLELNISEIGFGKWFNEDAMLFRDTNCSSVVCEIELLWGEIHHQFMLIYEICVLNHKKNIFGMEKPLGSSEKELAGHHYQEIVFATDKLKNKLRAFEKQLQAKGEQEFEIFGSYLEAEEERKKVEAAQKKKSTSQAGGGGARGAYQSE